MNKMTSKDKINEWIAKIKQIKHIKIIMLLLLLAAILLIVGSVTAKKSSIFTSFSSQAGKNEEVSTVSLVEKTDEETKLAKILSQINGVGETHVMITRGDNDSVKGVIVVANGADKPLIEWKIRKAVQTALQIDYKNVEVYSMN